MNYKKAHIISFIVASLGFAAFLPFGFSRDSSSVLLGLAFFAAGVIPGVIIRLAFCRCPNCGRTLYYRNFSSLKFCPNCGEELDEQHDDYL